MVLQPYPPPSSYGTPMCMPIPPPFLPYPYCPIASTCQWHGCPWLNTYQNQSYSSVDVLITHIQLPSSSFHMPFANNLALFISIASFFISNFAFLICSSSPWIATRLLIAVRLSCCSVRRLSMPFCFLFCGTGASSTTQITLIKSAIEIMLIKFSVSHNHAPFWVKVVNLQSWGTGGHRVSGIVPFESNRIE